MFTSCDCKFSSRAYCTGSRTKFPYESESSSTIYVDHHVITNHLTRPPPPLRTARNDVQIPPMFVSNIVRRRDEPATARQTGSVLATTCRHVLPPRHQFKGVIPRAPWPVRLVYLKRSRGAVVGLVAVVELSVLLLFYCFCSKSFRPVWVIFNVRLVFRKLWR